MPRKTIFLFSGQGSQYFQMGHKLYAGEPEFRRQMDQLDAFHVKLTGYSLVAELYGARKPTEAFDNLLLSHPAIVMIECALAQTLIQSGIKPNGTLGCSLGSFAAAAVSGMILKEQALTLAVRQAQDVHNACHPGAMIAILADNALYQEEVLKRHAVIAAYNFSRHFVVTTPHQNLQIVNDF